MFTHEQEIYPTLPQNEGHAIAFEPGEEAWVSAEEDDTALTEDTESKAALTEEDAVAENLVAQYFGDVRRYALLTTREEQALWRRIEHWKARVRRALCTSPIALPTLIEVWQQVQQSALPLQQVLENVDITTPDLAERYVQLGEALQQLQDLARRLQRLAAQRPAGLETVSAQRMRRCERVRLWHQWIATCEALQLHPSVYERLRQALDVAQRLKPGERPLRAAYNAWGYAQETLEQVKAQMLRANLRLVIYVANRYRGHGVPFLDLIQEGNIGLMRALEKFEPHRGLKFITYAHWWVRQAISRAVAEQHRTIRLPNHVIERQSKLRAASERLWYVHGRAPSVQELSTTLNWTLQEVEEILTATQPIARLYQPLTEDGGVLTDLIEDVEAFQPEELVVEEQLHHRVAECLATLPQREAFILRLRYGLEEAKHPHSLKEIGDILGVSRERVRQLEKQALDKLRKSQCSALLADFAEVA